MAPPQRTSGSIPFPTARASANGIERSVPAYEIIKVRVLMKLQDRLDPGKSRRMPPSLFQQTARQQIEQVIEVEAPRLNRADRDRLAEEVFREAFGFGPLEELFPDATVKEILVLGPQAVVVRRANGWIPTNVKFRDSDHLQEVLDRMGSMGEAVAPGLGHSAVDVRLSNGFRVVAVIPPPVLNQPTTALFVRAESGSQLHAALPPGTPTHTPSTNGPGTGGFPPVQVNGNGKAANNHLANGHLANGHPPSGTYRAVSPPAVGSPLASPAPGEHLMARHRQKITERLITRLASLGVYDLARVEITELRRIVAAFVEEHCRAEKIYLSDTDQGRLTLEILTAMNR